jgi:hypothetical protein
MALGACLFVIVVTFQGDTTEGVVTLFAFEFIGRHASHVNGPTLPCAIPKQRHLSPENKLVN